MGAREREAAARSAYLTALEERERISKQHSSAVARVKEITSTASKLGVENRRKMQFLSRYGMRCPAASSDRVSTRSIAPSFARACVCGVLSPRLHQCVHAVHIPQAHR